MDHFNLVVQLGSQVMYVAHEYVLPPHTRMRTEAAAHLLHSGKADRLVVVGGSNFGVRYDNLSILRPPNFTFDAFALSTSNRDSEAKVIREALVAEFGCRAMSIFAETLSSTTKENAQFLKLLLERRPMFTGDERIGLLTLLYHMQRAYPTFVECGVETTPVFAENVLADADPRNIDRICEYYSEPRGGTQYEVTEIRRLLESGESLKVLMT